MNSLKIFLFLPVLFLACSEQKEPDVEICQVVFADFHQRDGIHAFWHWMDGAITREGITRDLEAMKEQGVTQIAILNVSLFGSREMDVPRKTFANDEWFDLFRWALDEAARLDLRIGMHPWESVQSSEQATPQQATLSIRPAMKEWGLSGIKLILPPSAALPEFSCKTH